jgi:hypothetical protein
MDDQCIRQRSELGWGTLTHELRRRGEPLREWFEERFPRKEWIFDAVRQKAGRYITKPPCHESSHTVGWAFELMLRFMFDQFPKVDEAYSGVVLEVSRAAVHRGYRGAELWRIRDEWRWTVDLAAVLAQSRLNVRNNDDIDADVESALRACWVLALCVEFSRHASLERSVLLPLLENPLPEAALRFAPQPVVDDLLRLYQLSFSHIAPLVGRGLEFAPDLKSPIEALPDMLLGSSMLEIKCCTGRRLAAPGMYSYGLRSAELYQMIAYGLLAHRSHGVDAIALFNPRWNLMIEWSLAEIVNRVGLSYMDVHRISGELYEFLLAGNPMVAPPSVAVTKSADGSRNRMRP